MPGQLLRFFRAGTLIASCSVLGACSGIMSGLKEGSTRNSDTQMVAITAPSQAQWPNQIEASSDNPGLARRPSPHTSNTTPVTALSELQMDSINVAIKALNIQLDEQSVQIAALRQDVSSKASTSDFESANEIIRSNEARMAKMAGRIAALEADIRKNAIIRKELEKEPSGPFAGDGGSGTGPTTYGIHVGSFGNAESLSGAWNDLQSSFPALLGNKNAYFSQLDIDGVGTYHRLLAGPFSGQSSARAACQSISESGGYCRVTPLAGERLLD